MNKEYKRSCTEKEIQDKIDNSAIADNSAGINVFRNMTREEAIESLKD